MSRRQLPCFIATQDELLASGHQPDRHGLKQALWESASNVYFADGKVRRKKTEALAYTGAAFPVRGIGQLRDSSGQRWLWTGAGGSIHRWEFGAPELILAGYGAYQADQTSIADPTVYDFTPYGNWMIVNDGIQPRIFKPGTPNTFNVWGGEVPQGALMYMKVMSFILAFGYDTRKTRVGWCDPDNIDTWTAAPTNLAGSLTIDEFDTPMRTAAKLGTAVAVYGADQMSFIRYIGGTSVFGFNPGLDGIGAIGKAAVATDTRVNVGMSRDGAWWTDGNTFKFIDEGIIKDYFQDNINWAQGGKICVSRNDATSCFEFRFPKFPSMEVNEAWSWNPTSGGWSQLPFAGSQATERRLFDYPIVGGVDGKVYLGDFDYSAAQPLALSTKPLMLVQEDGSNRGTHIVSHVDELELWLKDAAFIEARVGCAEEPEGPWEWDDWRAVDVGCKIVELGYLPEMPLWKIQLRSIAGHDTDWRLNLQGLFLYGPSTGTKANA
jgi:hypothetical protein